jgi:uncharacterized protein (DUF427 family)
MKLPGPDHPISITPNPQRLVLRLGGRVIADTTHALVLQEASYPPVNYFPRADVDMAALSASTHTTVCPFKGDASYYNLDVDGVRIDNAVWSYETPHEAVGSIKGHLAFYPQHVQLDETHP